MNLEQRIATWFSIAVVLAGLIGGFYSLFEFKGNAQKTLQEHTAEIINIKYDQTNTERYQKVELRLQEITFELKSIRGELEQERRKK